MNNLSTILGQRLLTIGDVSKGTGLSRGTVSAIYHRNVNTVKIATLKRICDYLQIPLSELIEYTPKAVVKET
ncbi:helix-turn-helix domain-containing protein [Levilactobacillus andaensis]|uniref:helix-turn-helix domain-containing protein n=1 Tax=Levilactobacillus andaensis TaxID=2799570 RepID=UPI001944EA23|nr:helix-turn-helix transcriptional regulator [Levilactobacillus andaensis]